MISALIPLSASTGRTALVSFLRKMAEAGYEQYHWFQERGLVARSRYVHASYRRETFSVNMLEWAFVSTEIA